MAIGLTLKTFGGSTTDGTTFTSASVTPAANTTYLICCDYSNGITAPPVPPSSITAWGVTFTQLTTLFYKNTSTNRVGIALYVGRTGASPSAGVVTFTYAATCTGMRWHVIELTGVSTSGTNGSGAVGQIVKTAENATATNGANFTVTLASPVTTNSRSFAFFGANASTIGNNPLSGWTELDESAQASPSQLIASYWHSTAFQTTAGMANATGANETAGLIAFELLEPAGGTTWNVDATLAATATITAGAALAPAVIGASVAATASIGAAATASHPVDAVLTATASITAGGVRTAPVTAGLAVTASITTDAAVSKGVAAVPVAVTATISAVGAEIQTIGLTLAVTASLTSTASASHPVDAALPITATIGAAGLVTKVAGAALAATASISATATLTYSTGASLAVTATITAGAKIGVTYAQAVLADSPLGYWRLGDAAGATTAVDSSGNARHGTPGTTTNAPTFNVAGLLTGDADTAASFDGGDYIQLPNTTAFNANTITAEAWATTSSAAIQEILGRDTGTAGQRVFQFRVNAGVVEFTMFDSAGNAPTLLGAINVNNGARHHLVATWDGTTMTLYVDGVRDTTSVPGRTINQPASETRGMMIGARNNGPLGGTYFIGTLDEVAYYGTALSASQVAAHYTAGSGQAIAAAGASLAVTASITAAASVAALAQVAAVPLAITATIGAAAPLTAVAGASLPVTAGITASAARTATVAATLPVTASISADATASHPIAASLPITASIGAAATTAAFVAVGASLAVTATIAATAVRTATVDASIPVTATIAAGAVRAAVVGTTVPVTATISADAAITKFAAATTLAVTATIGAGAVKGPVVTTSLAATATITAVARLTATVAATVPATVTITAGAVLTARVAATTVATTATITATAATAALQTIAAALPITASIGAAALITRPTGATVATTATLTATAAVTKPAGAGLSVTATITATAEATHGLPVKWWNGTTWVAGRAKRWNGSQWVTAVIKVPT